MKPKGKPLPFTTFCEKVLRVRLRPGQRVVARICYDGADPAELEGDEQALARQIFGDVDHVPREARDVIVIVAGARGGKSYVLSALRLLHLGLTVPLPTLAPGETAVGVCVAPTLKLAQQVLGYIRGAIEGCPDIARIVAAQTTESILLQRPDGARVSLECLAATARGAALRGRSLVGVAMDEAAMFRDPETGAVNDEEVFRAVAPRVVRGGQIIIASTPWAETGLLHALFKANHGKPQTALVAHAPTLLLRDDEHTRAYVAREQQRDPTNARREFGAEFMSGDALSFFDGRAIAAAVDEGINLPVALGENDDEDERVLGFGADLGFRRDSSALVGVLRDVEDTYRVIVVEEQVPTSEALVPSAVVTTFAGILKRYGEDTVVCDSYYSETFGECLEAASLYLTQAPKGPPAKVAVYMLARTLLHEGRVKLPNHDRLLRQLREVTGTPTAGGGMSIDSPRWRTGGHGDLVSALVLALWRAEKLGRPTRTEHGPEVDSPEWHELMAKRRKEQIIERNRRRADPDENEWILGDYE